MIAFKLFTLRKDGSLGSLFIHRKGRVPIGEWITARNHRRPKGFTKRPGWHACAYPIAPHLSLVGRAWYIVHLKGVKVHNRPARQGETWYTAKQMKVIERVEHE